MTFAAPATAPETVATAPELEEAPPELEELPELDDPDALPPLLLLLLLPLPLPVTVPPLEELPEAPPEELEVEPPDELLPVKEPPPPDELPPLLELPPPVAAAVVPGVLGVTAVADSVAADVLPAEPPHAVNAT